jgi:hypothetical protein
MTTNQNLPGTGQPDFPCAPGEKGNGVASKYLTIGLLIPNNREPIRAEQTATGRA